MLKRVLALAALVCLLSGCEEAANRLPEYEYEPPLFSNTRQEALYRAPDGAELPPYYEFPGPGADTEVLRVQWSFPHPNYWDDLNIAVIQLVCDQLWYQGPQYDLDALLADALADWRDAQATGREFQWHLVEQTTRCTAETERFWNFCTSLLIPDGDWEERRVSDDVIRSQFFDKATGEELPLSALFLIPEADIPAALYDRATAPWLDDAQRDDAQIDAPARADFLRQFSPDYVSLRGNGLSIDFPAHTLAENSWGFSIPYEDLQSLLHPWAIPAKPTQP